MSGYSDGFKRGTNYNRRLAAIDPRAELAAGSALAAKCVSGEHDEQVVSPRYRVWSWVDKRHRETGERYCARCGLTMPPVPAEGEGPIQ